MTRVLQRLNNYWFGRIQVYRLTYAAYLVLLIASVLDFANGFIR